MHETCDHYDFTRPEANAVRRMLGLPLEIAIQRLFPAVDVGFSLTMSETYKTIFRDMRKAGQVDEPLYPGILNVLDQLDGAGWLMGIATGKAMRGLKLTLEHHALLDRFITQQTADRAQGKPHPEMLLNALGETGVEADCAVMIGDTTFDVEMAVNAGVKCIGVAWGYHESEELMDAGAVAVVHTADELVQTLFANMEPTP